MQPTIDARIAIDRDPLPLAKLRSFPVGRSRPTHQAWLTAGGSELILASSRRQWLFLWIAGLERRSPRGSTPSARTARPGRCSTAW